MTDRELMQMARNALMYLWDGCPTDKDLIERLDDHLAQPEPEPEVGVCCQDYDSCIRSCTPRGQWIAHKAAQREWQGLTDEDRQEIERWIEFKEAGGNEPVPAQKIITYVEAKLKEKNNG